MANNLSVEQRILCSQLEDYSPEIKTAYLGAIHTLHAEDYDDRLVHFTHSLREVIDLLTRKNQTDEERRRPLLRDQRISLLASVIDPAGKQVYEFGFLYEHLVDEYNELSEFAHHRYILEQKCAEEKLSTVENILFRLTRPQTEILDDIDEIISTNPSKDAALKLKSYLFRWSSHSYLLDKLPCEWLQSLDDAGFFDNPQPMLSSKKQKSGAFPYWMPSGYLAKCVSSMPDEVTKIILKCEFKNSSERNPAIYDDFLKSSLELTVNDMEKIAQKAIDEKWHDFADNYFIAEKYTDLAERLYLEGKYDIALKMLSHFLDSTKIGKIRHYHNYDIEKILNEKTPRLSEKNPLGIGKLLASFVEELVKQEEESKSYDSSYMLLKSIEDHEQNSYLMHNVSAICLVNLRNCLICLGNTNPDELKANMNILSERKFYIFRKLEIFLYEKFPDLFKNEISKSLIDFFDVYQVHHEYYHLLKNTFGKMDEAIQKKILDLIKITSQKIFDECKKEKDEEYANVRRNAWILRKLEPIHDHLEGKDREQYEKLVQELGIPSHPDFDDYMEVSIGQSASEPEFFSGKTIDEVFNIIKEHKPASHKMPYEDRTIASFGDYVRNNPLGCSKKSTEIDGLDLKIQYTFLSAIENSVNTKKEIDWNPVITLIENYVSSASLGASFTSMYDPMLESCRIIEKGLKENQIDFSLKDRVWNLIQRFIEFSNRTDVTETEYPNENTDSLTISINNMEGLSFHMLFRYVWWCHDHAKSKDVFTDDVKKILGDYINKKLGSHTISRHSAIGLYIPTMLYFDPEWTDGTVLSKIFSSKSNKIAFWDSFVSFNQVQKNTLLHLHGLYNEFLNGSITNNMHEKNFYHSTIEHVTLGYFYDITHFDKIFDRFLENNDSVSIDHCGFFISRILSGNPDVSKFKNKIIKLWKNQNFIDHAKLDMWFSQNPFDKKENIELFLHYMKNYTGKFNSTYFSLDDLAEYADDFPDEVVQCIQLFLEKLDDSYHLPNMLKSILKTLSSKKISSVDKYCKKIIEDLVTRGYNDYKDLL